MHINGVRDTLAQKVCQNKVEEKILIAIQQRQKQHYWHQKMYFERWSRISFAAYLNAMSFFVSRDHVGFFLHMKGVC